MQGSETFNTLASCLQKLYKDRMLPIEEPFGFHSCHSPKLTDADFTAKPMVLLLGQYSAGKSTFIRHLLGRDYPGLRIGPEPTTDRFVAVQHGDSDQVIPGNAAVVDQVMNYSQLSGLGNAFLSRFEVAKMKSPCLEGITLIDTPGVLSGEKQRVNRGYSFDKVVKWFAERVDTILVLFEVSNLDISDEFRKVIEACKGHDSKIRILLNKADRCTTPQLMRVYGALMWNLNRVMGTPEVTRVYMGSFWDEPLQNDELRSVFEAEEHELYSYLADLPRSAGARKVNDLIKRARLAKVHANLLDALRAELPWFGKEERQAELIEQLPNVYRKIAGERGISMGDFPDCKEMQIKLARVPFSAFPKLDKKLMEPLDHMLTVEAPKLLAAIPHEAARASSASILNVGKASPFGARSDSMPRPNVEEFREQFDSLKPIGGRVSGGDMKDIMEQSQLPTTALHRIWNLASTAVAPGEPDDLDGLDLWQFAVAMTLVDMKSNSKDLPQSLPNSMMPSKGDIEALVK